MATHYSTKDFFRNTPNAMLARYFAARDILEDFDFTAIKETKIEPLFEAWMAVPEAQRAKMEVDLRAIGDMSNEKGAKAIIDEAEFHMDEDGEHHAFIALLMALAGFGSYRAQRGPHRRQDRSRDSRTGRQARSRPQIRCIRGRS